MLEIREVKSSKISIIKIIDAKSVDKLSDKIFAIDHLLLVGLHKLPAEELEKLAFKLLHADIEQVTVQGTEIEQPIVDFLYNLAAMKFCFCQSTFPSVPMLPKKDYASLEFDNCSIPEALSNDFISDLKQAKLEVSDYKFTSQPIEF